MGSSGSSRWREIGRGLQDCWAVMLGMVPLGLAFGLLVVQMGFAWWWAPVFSIVIYAGSMEFLALGLVTAGTTWVTALVTGLLVNFRHIFYGLTYPRHRIPGFLGKAYATYALTDEVYAVTGAFGADGREADRPVSGTRLLTITATCQLAWVLSGAVGAALGTRVHLAWEGLDFALTALFVVLAMSAMRANPDLSLVATAIMCAVVAAVVAPGHVLVVALTLYFLIVLVRYVSPPVDSALTWQWRSRR